MKVIALEEHVVMPPAADAPKPQGAPALVANSMIGAPWLTNPDSAVDLGEQRLADMDANGITMQVLSMPSSRAWTAENAVEESRKANDYIAQAVKNCPDRFAGFAALPTAVPEACSDELERAVKELGLVGSLIGNRVDGITFLDAPEFEPYLAKSEELNVPIYLHPGPPPEQVTECCYSGSQISAEVTSVFSRYGFGWHADAGIHMMHMILSGVFDRHPNLQIILGHWGEFLPYYIDRFDDALPTVLTGLKHEPSYYLRNNMYVTSSGINTPEALEFCIAVLGADRVMFSADYPFASFKGSDKLLQNPAVSEENREKFAHGNAERLLKL